MLLFVWHTWCHTMLTLLTAYKFMLRRTWNALRCMLWPVSLSAHGMASICFIHSAQIYQKFGLQHQHNEWLLTVRILGWILW